MEGIDQELKRATFFQRLIASVIDHFLFFNLPLLFIFVYAPSVFEFLTTPPDFLPNQVKFFYYTLMYFGITTTLTIPFYKFYSATPGKMIVGLKLADIEGRETSINQIFHREFTAKQLNSYTLLLGYLLCLVRKDRQTLHDSLARTQVIQKSDNDKLKKAGYSLSLGRSLVLNLSLILAYFFYYDISTRLIGKAQNMVTESLKERVDTISKSKEEEDEDEDENSTSGQENNINITTQRIDEKKEKPIDISNNIDESFDVNHYEKEEISDEEKKAITEKEELRKRQNEFRNENMAKYRWAKLLKAADFDLSKLDLEYMNEEIIRKLIIQDYPEIMKTYQPGVKLPDGFLKDFFDYQMLAEVYFNDEALKNDLIKAFVDNNRKQYSVDDVAKKTINRIEEYKVLDTGILSNVSINPLLKNNRMFLEFMFNQRCETIQKIKIETPIPLTEPNIKLAVRLLLADEHNLRLKCFPSFLSQDVGFIKEIVSISSDNILTFNSPQELEVIKANEELNKLYNEKSIEKAIRGVRSYTNSINNGFGGRREPRIPNEVWESSIFQKELLENYPSFIKEYPKEQEFNIELVNIFLQRTYKPMRFFNSSHSQYKEIETSYGKLKNKLKPNELKVHTINHSLSLLKGRNNFQNALALIDEDILNDPSFYEEAFKNLDRPDEFFSAIPTEYEYSQKFKDSYIEHSRNNPRLRFFSHRGMPDKLKQDVDFMKRLREPPRPHH